MKLFSQNLKFLRKRAGFTQSELGEKIGVGTTTISNYEAGNSEPNIDLILSLSKVLGVSLDMLIIGESPKSYKPIEEEVMELVGVVAERQAEYNKLPVDMPAMIAEYLRGLEKRIEVLEKEQKVIK